MVRTVLFWLVCSLIVLTLGPIFIIVGCFDKSKKITDKIACFWVKTLILVSGIKIEIEDKEKLKLFDQFIIVSNHISYFDVFVLIYILNKVPHFLAKKELFRIPIFGWCLRVADVIEIDRENPAVALESIGRALSKGLNKPIVIYPEGTRSITGKLQNFRKKGLKLLFKTGLPIVPIVFIGTREVMPKGSYRVKPNLVRVFVLDPIYPDVELERLDEDRLIDMIRDRMDTIVSRYY